MEIMSFDLTTYQVLLAAGLLMAAVDILILGFATFFLTIIGLSTVLTGVLVFFGLVSDSPLAITFSIAILSGISAVALYQPFKRMQSKKNVEPKDVQSDLTDMTFILEQDVGPQSAAVYHFSGVDWKLRTSEFLIAGTEVKVTKLAVGEMFIARLA